MANTSQLTVFFEESFYRGVFERTVAGRYQVAKVTFGTQESTTNRIQQLINCRWSALRWTTGTPAAQSDQTSHNAKKRQRRAQQAIHQHGSSLQAGVALKLEHKQNLADKKKRRKAQRQAHAEEVRLKSQAKRLAKHRGH